MESSPAPQVCRYDELSWNTYCLPRGLGTPNPKGARYGQHHLQQLEQPTITLSAVIHFPVPFFKQHLV
jgi:hypothetical protein